MLVESRSWEADEASDRYHPTEQHPLGALYCVLFMEPPSGFEPKQARFVASPPFLG